MSYDTPTAPTLFDLLARAWRLDGPVGQVVFNRDGTAVAFAAAGTLGLAGLADPERPETRMRMAADTGRQTISPRKSPVRPLVRVEGTGGPVVPWGARSFLTGGAGGALLGVTPRGQAVPLAHGLAGPPTALARAPDSDAVAAAVGATLTLLPDDLDGGPTQVAAPGAVTTLAHGPGGLVAVGHDRAVSLWRDGWIGRVALAGAPATLSLSPDGALLAVGLAGPGIALVRLADLSVDAVPDYPTATRGLAWSVPGAALVTSGAFRTVAWGLGPEGRGQPLAAGRTGLVIVDQVAASPTLPLAAAGYASGLVSVTKLGSRDEMMLRGNGAPVTAMAWAPDGAHLAFGDADGHAACVSFPPNLFK